MDVIIIDEVSMISWWILDEIDRILRDVTNSNAPFGGKTVLLGGDFRQVRKIQYFNSYSLFPDFADPIKNERIEIQ